MSSPRLSAVLIAKDEELDLPGALDSLRGLADEIVVLVDTASSDKTEAIARERGAKVALRPFDNYAGQKQAALELAAGEWVISIDSDERISSALAEEIRQLFSVSSVPTFVAFIIPFEIRFLGQVLRWGGLGHEKHLRLFRRDRGRFVGGALPEGIEVQGPTGNCAPRSNTRRIRTSPTIKRNSKPTPLWPPKNASRRAAGLRFGGTFFFPGNFSCGRWSSSGSWTARRA